MSAPPVEPGAPFLICDRHWYWANYKGALCANCAQEQRSQAYQENKHMLVDRPRSVNASREQELQRQVQSYLVGAQHKTVAELRDDLAAVERDESMTSQLRARLVAAYQQLISGARA